MHLSSRRIVTSSRTRILNDLQLFEQSLTCTCTLQLQSCIYSVVSLREISLFSIKNKLSMLWNNDIRGNGELGFLAAERSLGLYDERYRPIAQRGWRSNSSNAPSSIPVDYIYHVRLTGAFVKQYGIETSQNGRVPNSCYVGRFVKNRKFEAP